MPARPALLLLLSLSLHCRCLAAQIVSLPFRDCSPSPSTINITTVYAQLASSDTRATSLNFTIIGASAVQIEYSSNTTQSFLSTVLAPTSVLTFAINPNSASQSLCRSLRPPSPLPPLGNDPNNAFCPLAPGPLAFAVGTPLARSYELTSLNTQIRVLDTSDPAQLLACVSVDATPLRPAASVYGHAAVVFWATAALAIGYWLLVGAARLAAAWKRGRQRVHANIWSRVQGLGFALASAVSGERFASSPALLRFGTPSMRDVVFHTQWCTLLGMLSVQWPRFAYPFFAQTAWATLLYNISLTQPSKHWDPLHTDPFSPPSEFADQIADPGSPLYLNPGISNTLFTLPREHPTTGIPALAASVGVRPQDAFDVAATLFGLIIAGTVVLSVSIFSLDRLIGSLVRASGRAAGTRTPPWSSGAHKEFGESPEPPALPDDDVGSGTVRFLHRPASRTIPNISPPPKGWLTDRLGQSSFHGSVLHGNLVRVLVLFHLPISIFACYQFSAGTTQSSLAAVVVAALTFVVFSLAIPAWLLLRLSTTPTPKLYDETRTLLMLGPLYNHYTHGSQLFAALFFVTNIAYAVTLGCGQQSGTAQAIIILVVEVAVALMTSVWLPWGREAEMGGISFMFCVARIITAVLLVILSPVVSVGDAAGGWIAYAILVIQGLVYASFFLMLFSKALEGLVRLVWDVSFDHSKHPVDTGLIGAIGLAPCCGRRRRRRAHASHSHLSSASSTPSHALGDTRTPPRRAESDSTRNMLPPAASQSHTTVPSVLRPEQLNQPYREDSDDEGGYILGAWHYDDEPSPDLDADTEPNTRPATPGATSSGFSRVAGGRANLESPFTMASSPGTALQSGSASNLHLPPGAMAPGPFPHARRQSQSAIIEHAETRPNSTTTNANHPSAADPYPNGGARSTAPWRAAAATFGLKARTPDVHAGKGVGAVPGSTSAIASEITRGASPHEDFPLQGAARRRRRWPGFGLFASASSASPVDEEGQARGWGRRGAGSATDSEAPMLLPLADEAASSASASQASPGAPSASRTFVVIRDRRPSLRPSPLSQTHTHVPDAGGEADPERAEPAFAVVRPNRNTRPSSPLAGTPSFSSSTSPHASSPDIPLRPPQPRREAPL